MFPIRHRSSENNNLNARSDQRTNYHIAICFNYNNVFIPPPPIDYSVKSFVYNTYNVTDICISNRKIALCLTF